MGSAEIPASMLCENLLHDSADLRRSAYQSGVGEHVAQTFRGKQGFVQNLSRNREDPTFRSRYEVETVHMADWNVDYVHRSQHVSTSVERRLAATTSDQEHLMQPCMPMNCNHPIVLLRTDGNHLAMHNVRQVGGLAKEIVDLDNRVGAYRHVRIVQGKVQSLHRLLKLAAKNSQQCLKIKGRWRRVKLRR